MSYLREPREEKKVNIEIPTFKRFLLYHRNPKRGDEYDRKERGKEVAFTVCPLMPQVPCQALDIGYLM